MHILLIEVEEIVNSRPLTTDLLSDVNSMIPFSPINQLSLKSRAVMLPPRIFTASDIYCLKHWRRVHHISSNFSQHFSVGKNGTPLGEIAKW